MKALENLGIVVAVIAVVAIVIFLVGWIFSLFWNFVMPYLFGLKEIDWAQALAVLVVFQALFGKSVPVNVKV